MLEAIAFYGLAGLILGFGVMVITARSAVHSVVFLVLNFLAVFFASLAVYTASSPAASPVPATTPAVSGNTEQVGLVLYTDYLIAFEVASMLLLAAMVGAILFARRMD